MHIYEYLFTGVIIVVMLGASIALVNVLSQPAQDAADKELLQITTDKIMTQILVDPGYPFDWGSEGSSPSGFGLAKYGATSREIYLLDPDKVQRLNPNIGSEYVEPKEVLNCLNLGRDYGLTLEIAESLNLEVTPQTGGGTQAIYDIDVTSATNLLPVKNANITASLFWLNGTAIESKSTVRAATDFVGNATLNFNCEKSPYDILVISVDYAGLHLAKVVPMGSDTLTGYMVGDRIESAQPYTLNTETIQATEVIVTEQQGAYIIGNYAATITDTDNPLVLESKPEASTVAVLVTAKNSDGTTVLLVGHHDFKASYRSSPAIQSGSFSYSIERKASISGTTYTVTLYLWRMAL